MNYYTDAVLNYSDAVLNYYTDTVLNYYTDAVLNYYTDAVLNYYTDAVLNDNFQTTFHLLSMVYYNMAHWCEHTADTLTLIGSIPHQ